MYTLSRISATLPRILAAGSAAVPQNGLMSSLSKINQEAAIRIQEAIRPDYRLRENAMKLASSLCPTLHEHAEYLMRGPGRWNDQDQRDAWFAHQTASALKHLEVFTALHYRPLARDMPLESAIMPGHLAMLERTVRDSFHLLSPADKIKLAASVESGVLESCGVQVPAEFRNAVEGQRSNNSQRLTKSEMLALIDYVHSDTGTFNVVNGSARLSHYFNFSAMVDVVHCMDGPRKSALNKLAGNPDFIQSGDMYKGVNFNNPSGHLSFSNLKRSLESGGEFSLAHPTFATLDPFQSYAYREHYDTELLFEKQPVAIGLSVFHDRSTTLQQEVVIPCDARFHVTGRETVQLDTNEGPRIIDRFRVECTRTAQAGPAQ